MQSGITEVRITWFGDIKNSKFCEKLWLGRVCARAKLSLNGALRQKYSQKSQMNSEKNLQFVQNVEILY